MRRLAISSRDARVVALGRRGGEERCELVNSLVDVGSGDGAVAEGEAGAFAAQVVRGERLEGEAEGCGASGDGEGRGWGERGDLDGVMEAGRGRKGGEAEAEGGGEMTRDGGEEANAAIRVGGEDAAEVARERPVLEELGEGALRFGGAVAVGEALGVVEGGHQRWRRDEEAEAERGDEDLGEGADVEDAAAAIEAL